MESTELFWRVITATFFYSFIPLIVKLLLSLYVRNEPPTVEQIKKHIKDLKNELLSISMVDEFAKYAKVQRKIRKYTEELANYCTTKSNKILRVKVITSTFLHLVIVIYLSILLWYNANAPVITVPPEWLYPLNKIISFPSNIPGSIGLPFWITLSSSVAKTTTNIFKFSQ